MLVPKPQVSELICLSVATVLIRGSDDLRVDGAGEMASGTGRPVCVYIYPGLDVGWGWGAEPR